MSLEKRIAIAIDGPAGAGKSSISKVVAQRLGYLYIDTGAMYRAVTWAVLENGIDASDEDKVAALLPTLRLRMEASSDASKVFIDDREVTNLIRTQLVNQNVSKIAAQVAVRNYLVEQQREMANVGGVILDGRDIASVVLPDADLKIYLTASVDVRAKRRYLEIKDIDTTVTLEEIKKSVSDRDEMDKNRKESPLVCVPEAIVVDSSALTFDETVEVMTKLALGVINA